MADLALQLFGGLVPKTSDYLLEVSQATIAENCLLRSGELRGLHRPIKLTTITSPTGINRIFRIPDTSGVDIFVPFVDRFTHFLKGQLVNDLFDRYYWCDATSQVPQYNSLARIENDSSSYRLGIPKPANPVADEGLTGFAIGRYGVNGTETKLIYSEAVLVVTRAYVYTFVSEYGEEGAPSDPILLTLPESNQWVIPMVVDPGYAAQRTIVSKKIYRTITDSEGVADYYFVAEVPVTQASYTDVSVTSTISFNNLLDSLTWSEPPAGLQGIVAHPNGYLVGYVGRDIHFSEPYRPHAWPINYVVSTGFDIVGLGIYESSVAVCTEGNPYIIDGSHPAVTSLTKLEPAEPCTSHFGVVPVLDGVIYPSTNGLIFININGINNITRDLLTKDEWAIYDADNIIAAEEDQQYIAFDSVNSGFIYSPSEPGTSLINLSGSIWNTLMIQDDPRTGDLLIINNDVIYEWNPPTGIPIEYTWRSKKFVTNKPVNFGACKFTFDSSLTVTADSLVELEAYNTIRFAAGPLDTINFCPINDAGDTTVPANNLEPMKCPTGGSPLFNVAYFNSLVPRITFNMYADVDRRGQLSLTDQLQANRTIVDEELVRLPTGYKAKDWKFEFIGNADLQIMKIAETSKRLKNV